MNRRLVFNIAFNSLITAVFVWFNMWALDNGFEESFISLALFYGMVVIIGNAVFILLHKE